MATLRHSFNNLQTKYFYYLAQAIKIPQEQTTSAISSPNLLKFIIMIQAFIKYAKRPSNIADYWGIFDREARFRFERPTELQRKSFFDDQFPNQIMTPFFHHLRRNDLIPGSSEQQITYNIDKGNFDHDQFVIAFSSWLEQSDTVFVYIEKQKQEIKPSPPPPSQNYSTPVTQAPQPGLKPSNLAPKHAQGKKQTFIFQKVYQNQTPQKQSNVVTSYQTTQNQIRQMNDKKIPPELSIYPVQEQRPYAVRFREKLSDIFEYPQRIVSIKNEMSVIQNQKK